MQIAVRATFSDSINLRKQALQLAGLQVTSRPHSGVLFDVALLVMKAGMIWADSGSATTVALFEFGASDHESRYDLG